ncbi:MAG: hypothetical protein AAF628_32430 [Planctomycetota bacterium]
MVYDRARRLTVLFGGDVAGALAADTWAWNGSSWTPWSLEPNPSARQGLALAYHTARQRVVLEGGVGLSDTWELGVTAATGALLSSDGGFLGEPLTYFLQGDPFEVFALILSNNTGQTPLAPFCSGDPRVLRVGLGGSPPLIGTLDRDGLASVRLSVPGSPLWTGVQLHAQFVTIPGSSCVVDDVSNLATLTLTPRGGPLVAIPPHVSLAEAPVGAPVVTTLELANPGSSPVTITSVQATPPFGARLTSGFVVPPGGSLPVDVTYAASQLGQRVGSVTVQTSRGPLQVPASGVGIPDADSPPSQWLDVQVIPGPIVPACGGSLVAHHTVIATPRGPVSYRHKARSVEFAIHGLPP